MSDMSRKIKTPPSFFRPALGRAITSLWVYTDIIKPHMTGHSFSPLLRIIGVHGAGKAGMGEDILSLSFETRVEQFDRIHYYPLLMDEVSSITMHITNGGGKSAVQFSSPVIIKLHFRRRAL